MNEVDDLWFEYVKIWSDSNDYSDSTEEEGEEEDEEEDDEEGVEL
jgi:hypothetical protein